MGDAGPMKKNQMDQNMENVMQTGVIQGLIMIITYILVLNSLYIYNKG